MDSKRQREDGRPSRGLLRMRHLVERTGVSRETIHFYIAAGLVPPAYKTKKNAAFYGEEHVSRLELVRELRQKSFLPLKAIRELFDGTPDVSLGPDHRVLVAEVRARLGDASGRDLGRVRLETVLKRAGVSRREMREFRNLGMITIRGRGQEASIPQEDAALLDVWGRLKSAGAFAERGISPRYVVVQRDAVERLVADEMGLFAALYGTEKPGRAAEVLASLLPLLNEMFSLLHERRIRAFFDEAEKSAPARGRPTARRRTR